MASRSPSTTTRPFQLLFFAVGIVFIAVSAAYTLLNIADNLFNFSLILGLAVAGLLALTTGLALTAPVTAASNPGVIRQDDTDHAAHHPARMNHARR